MWSSIELLSLSKDTEPALVNAAIFEDLLWDGSIKRGDDCFLASNDFGDECTKLFSVYGLQWQTLFIFICTTCGFSKEFNEEMESQSNPLELNSWWFLLLDTKTCLGKPSLMSLIVVDLACETLRWGDKIDMIEGNCHFCLGCSDSPFVIFRSKLALKWWLVAGQHVIYKMMKRRFSQMFICDVLCKYENTFGISMLR